MAESGSALSAGRGDAGRAQPFTRPRGRLAFAIPLILAAGVGLAIGMAPRPTMVAVSALVAVLVLTVRLEWAALSVIGAAVFEDYLDLLSPWTTEALAALLVFAWALRRSRGRLHDRRDLTVVVPAGLFAVVLLLATALHTNGRAGAEVWARYAEFLVILLVLADCLSGPLAPRRAARVYVWACVAAAVCGTVAAVFDERHRVAGPLSNPADLGFFLVAALPLAAALRTTVRRTWAYDAAVVVLLLGTVGTLSRAAISGLAVMVVLAVAMRVLSLQAAGVLMVLVGTGAAFALAALLQPVGGTLADQSHSAETRISQRLDLWQSALTMTRDHPALGLGPGSFALYHQDYRDEDADLAGRDSDVAHSTVLESAAELGVLGAATLFAVFLVPLAGVYRRWKHTGSTLAAAVCLALVGDLVAALRETEQYHLPLWFLAALAVALAPAVRPGFDLSSADPSGPVGRRT